MAKRAKRKAPRQKRWTLLLYLAGDNNLDSAGAVDIAELKRVGSNDNVNLLAQFDRAGTQTKTMRYYLRKGTSLAKDAVQSLGETNMGDPRVLEEFLTWGLGNYPAQHYFVVLWNHGSGWDDTNVYVDGEAFGSSPPPVTRKGSLITGRGRRGAVPMAVARAGVKRARRALFSTSVARITTTRAIAFDDQAQDFLDNVEMKRVLSAVKKRLGRKIDILGFDACLMSMAEVAFQVRDLVDFSVGSEQTEPNDGWPYDRICKALVARPTMTPAELAKEVVGQYLRSYGNSDNVTLAATALSEVRAVASSIDQLAKALVSALDQANEIAPILAARQQVREYEPPYDEYVDLLDLADLFAAGVRTSGIMTACKAVKDAVRSAVIASGSKGSRVVHSNGLSVYFPKRRKSSLYKTLDFARTNAWGSFLDLYLERATARPN